MTLHSNVNYNCKNCGVNFVPLPVFKKCPKCNYKSTKVFNHFIEETIRSALFNLTNYGSFIPYGWGVFTIGDHYYWLAFQFLSFASLSLKVAEKDLFGKEISENIARKLALKFLDRLDFGEQSYMANTLEIYFVRLLCAPYIECEEEIQKEVSCFLSYCNNDKVFSDKLYSDLIASGIKCWYFPEDATYGKRVWEEISKQIYSCNKVIVVCSKNSLNSAPVLREIERVLQREDDEKKDILLPIKIDNYILKKWNHPRKADVITKVIGDFQEWNNRTKYRKSFNYIINAIKS